MSQSASAFSANSVQSFLSSTSGAGSLASRYNAGMRFRYKEWNGEEFATQDHLKLFDRFMEFVLEYGDQALEALKEMELDEEQRELLEKLIQEGLLEKIGAKWRLTPRA